MESHSGKEPEGEATISIGGSFPIGLLFIVTHDYQAYPNLYPIPLEPILFNKDYYINLFIQSEVITSAV